METDGHASDDVRGMYLGRGRGTPRTASAAAADGWALYPPGAAHGADRRWAAANAKCHCGRKDGGTDERTDGGREWSSDGKKRR